MVEGEREEGFGSVFACVQCACNRSTNSTEVEVEESESEKVFGSCFVLWLPATRQV